MYPIILADQSALHPVLLEILGWVPAVVFPAATLMQLVAILRRKSAEGVSAGAWTLFCLANICLFAYTEKYSELESILGTLGTAFLNLCIVAAALRYQWRARRTGAMRNGGGPGSVP